MTLSHSSVVSSVLCNVLYTDEGLSNSDLKYKYFLSEEAKNNKMTHDTYILYYSSYEYDG